MRQLNSIASNSIVTHRSNSIVVAIEFDSMAPVEFDGIEFDSVEFDSNASIEFDSSGHRIR